MADGLTTLSLAIGLLGSDPSVNAGDWKDYVWMTQSIETCLKTSCAPISLKWDWKRPQTVTVSLTSTMNGLTVRTRLSNDDPLDGDDVCVTLLLRDQAGVTIAVFHENTPLRSGHKDHQFKNAQSQQKGHVRNQVGGSGY